MPESQKRDNSDSRIASLKQQNKEYNEMYRKWRIDRKHDYGFYFLDNSDELTYRDGEGFITEYPEASERNAVNGIHSVAAKTLIIFTLMNILTSLMFSCLPFSLAGDVYYTGYGYFAGDEVPALILSYIVNILRRVLPIFYLIHKVKMPAKIMIPIKISNKPLFAESIFMAMLIFGIITVFSGFSFFSAPLMGINPANRIWIPKNKTILFFSSLLFTIIIPVISELIHRGVFMQTLRQFGDGYALLLTSVIAALTASNVHAFLFIMTYSLVIGYFTMRSGSILTAIMMRIVISCGSYWMTYIKLTQRLPKNYLTISIAVTLIFLIIGIISVIVFTRHHSNKINLPIYTMYMTQKEKFMCCIANPYVLVWIALTIVSDVILMEL